MVRRPSLRPRAAASPAALLLAAALLARPAAAQDLPDPLEPANAAPIVYCPPERLARDAPDPFHVLNVFLPPGPAPGSGWPVVVTTGYGGGASVPAVDQLRSSGATKPLFALVADGIAVVHFGLPGSSGGRGLWYPPGHPSRRHESWARADDSPEKSAQWVVQWTKVQGLYPLDPARVALRGASGGAVLMVRTAMGPALASATGSAQARASTRVAAVLAIRPPTSIWALVQGPELGLPIAHHLERADAPGVAADQLDQVEPELQKAYSLMRAAFASPEARARSARQPICLLYDDPVLEIDGQPATFLLDGSGFPVLHDAIAPPTQHDAWFGYRFWRSLTQLSPAAAAFHASNSILAVRDTSALAAPRDIHTHTFRGTVTGPEATTLAHEWLLRHLRGTGPHGPAAPPQAGLRGGTARMRRAGPGLELELPTGAARWAWLVLGAEDGARELRVAPVAPEGEAAGRACFAFPGLDEATAARLSVRAFWWPGAPGDLVVPER